MQNRKMTKAEHRRVMERAVRLQTAAVQEMKGCIFLPGLERYNGDLYEQVVAAGNDLLQKYSQGGEAPLNPFAQAFFKSLERRGSRMEKIISYYSRQDIQQAIFQYSRGRKISVLRNFHPMFSGSPLRKSDDVLPIMVFYSQEATLWPSIHGTISRYDADGRLVCDLVLETDIKNSRERSFSFARPLVRLFQNLGLEFRVKFSGHSSPHIIVPAEAFPQKWRAVGSCRYLYEKLFEFFRKQIIKQPCLDRSFCGPGHFLRMPYSLNENTGLVSVPVRDEDYDRFS